MPCYSDNDDRPRRSRPQQTTFIELEQPRNIEVTIIHLDDSGSKLPPTTTQGEEDMPCRDDKPWPTAEEMKKYYAEQTDSFPGEVFYLEAEKEIEFEFYKNKVNELTNMLCALGGEIEKFDSKILTHKFPDIGNWYYIHKQRDKWREEQEKREREQAILHKKRQLEELTKEIAALEESK